MPRKSRVVEALATRDFPGALAAALAAWRAARHPELASLVEAIAARCHDATIAGRGAAFHAAWMRLATGKPSPVAIGTLAKTLGKHVPVAKTRNYVDRDLVRHAAFLERIAALAALPDDPRIATAIVDVLEKAPYTIESGNRIYQPAIDLLVRLGDLRAVARLRALVEAPRTRAGLVRLYFAQALPAAAEAIAKAAGSPPSAETLATITSALAALAPPARPAPRGDVERLIAECLADLEDDGPREVLADVLQEREDPRGELITLQLREARGALSLDERTRVNALLRAHEKTWLGELAIVTKHRVWRRGFLDQAELARNAVADRPTWERTARHPGLATVRKLGKGAANLEHYRRFVESPASAALREITVASVDLLGWLATTDKPIEHLELELALTPVIQRGLTAVASQITRLTVRTRVTVPAILVQFARWPERARFTEISLSPPTVHASDWSVRGLPWLGAHDVLGVRRLGLRFDGIAIVVEEGAHGRVVEIESAAEWPVGWVLGELDRVARLVVRGPSAPPSPALAKQLAKLPAGALALPPSWATDRDRATRGRRS